MIVDIWVFVTGLCLGSFLKCLSDRYISKRDFILSSSTCDCCGHDLCFCDLVPLFSYLFLKGKCRYCGRKISAEYLFAEFIWGVVTIICYERGVNPYSYIYLCICFVISLIDMKIFEIPDICHMASVLVYLFGYNPDVKVLIDSCLVPCVLCILNSVMKLLFHKEYMGMGDIKFLLVLALFLGTVKTLYVLLFASVTGLIYMLISGKRIIAFGPFISIGAFVIFCNLLRL